MCLKDETKRLHDGVKKECACDMLVKEVKTVDKDTNRDTVVKKLSAFLWLWIHFSSHICSCSDVTYDIHSFSDRNVANIHCELSKTLSFLYMCGKN
jgi:hypothetical protein